MKKLLFSIFLFLTMPLMTYAANYKISDQLIKAEIQSNGDLKISELIVMDGTFNGYEKSLSYKNGLTKDSLSGYEKNDIYNASDLELIEIKGKKVDQVSFDTLEDTDFMIFSKTNYATNGTTAKYMSSTDFYGYTYRLYYPGKKEKVAFLVTYMLKNVIVMHEDVAELYWNFITPNDYDDIKNVQVKVLLPNVDHTDNFKLWLHGALSGEITKLEDHSGVLATYDYMEKSDVLDIRLTFDKNLIQNSSNLKKTNKVALDKIIEVEEERAKIANDLRAKLLKQYNFVKNASIFLFLVVIGGFVFIYKKYGKSPKSSYFSKYNREFIDDYNVEVIDYLMKKQITPNAMSASIMNLVYKKNISVEELPSKNTKKKDYQFKLLNDKDLNESERILIEFLFDRVGHEENNEKYFTTKELKKYADGTKTCNRFITSYTKWKNNVLDKGKDQKFYEKSGKPVLIGFIVFVFCLILFLYGIGKGVDFVLVYILPFIAFALLLYSILVDKKTQKGADHYARWKAFRNFLQDFGSFELKELPEIVLWERYLVYATIFGLADKVQKNMNVKIQEIDMTNYSLDMPVFFYLDLGNTIHSSVNNAISTAYSRQAANYANSHSSSSSGGGFGGGASFGGGFGGGGSSGHGF